jgi:hypothetical protein
MPPDQRRAKVLEPHRILAAVTAAPHPPPRGAAEVSVRGWGKRAAPLRLVSAEADTSLERLDD